MLRVYGHHKYFNSFSAGTVLTRLYRGLRQILTYKDVPIAERVTLKSPVIKDEITLKGFRQILNHWDMYFTAEKNTKIFCGEIS